MTLSRRVQDNLKAGGFIVLMFLFWEVACIIFHVSPIVLPRPSAIFSTLFMNLPALWPHILQTLVTTIIGFLLGTIIGLALGAFVGFRAQLTILPIRCWSDFHPSRR